MSNTMTKKHNKQTHKCIYNASSKVCRSWRSVEMSGFGVTASSIKAGSRLSSVMFCCFVDRGENNTPRWQKNAFISALQCKNHYIYSTAQKFEAVLGKISR